MSGGYLCRFIDSCPSIPSSSIPYFIPPSKPFRFLTPIHFSHNPPFPTTILRRSSRRRRRRRCTTRNPTHISALPLKFDLIETSEHHDGSIIFRFGDPSEIVKNEDLVSEGEEGSLAVKVVDSDHEKEVVVEEVGSEEKGESDISSSTDVYHIVNEVDTGNAVIERVSDVEEDLSDSLVELSGSESLVDDLGSEGEEGSNVAKVLDEDHEEQAIKTTLREATDTDCVIESSTDVSKPQVESSELDELVEDLESEDEEGPDVVNIDVDQERQVLNKTIEIEEMTDKETENDSSNSSDVSDSINEVDVGIAVVEQEKDLTDSQEESSEGLLEISQNEVVPLSLPVSVSDIKINDFISSGLGLENADSMEASSDGKDEDVRSSPVELEVAADSFSIERIDDPEEVVAGVVNFESPYSKIKTRIEDPNVEVMQSSDQKIESGSLIEVADSSNEADKNISVVEGVSDLVEELSDSQPEPSEMRSVVSQEVGVPVSDSEIRTNDHFDSVGSLADAVADEESLMSIIGSRLSIENNNNIGEVTAEDSADVNVVQSFIVEMDDMAISDSINEAVNMLEDVKDQNIVSELPIPQRIDSGETDTEEVTPLAQTFEDEAVLDDGVGHDALEQSAKADDVDVDVESGILEKDLADSQEESSEGLLEISQDREVPLPLPVSVADDFSSSALGLKNTEGKEKSSDEKDENASSSPVELEVAADSSIERNDDPEEVIADVVYFESPSSKIEPIIEDSNVEVMQLSDQKIESGSQIEVADSSNEADGDISVVEGVSDLVKLSDSQPKPSEIRSVVSQEVGMPISDSEIRTNDHFDTVGSLEDADTDVSSVIDSSLSIENSDDIGEVTAEDSADVNVVQSPFVELDDMATSEPINEVVNLLVDVKDQNIMSELQLPQTIDSDEIATEEGTPMAQVFEAEPVLIDGVGHDALEEFAKADDVESEMLLNKNFSNSLVGAETPKVEEQSSELSEVSIVEAIQLELAETGVNREEIFSTTFLLSSGAAALAHPSKALTGGEDAYFLSCSKWLGVADGISKWSLEGIDRGVYAHDLMKNCENIVSDNGSATMVKPVEVLARSVEETESSGSSTVLVAYFDGQALHVANIGDTGFLIIRHGAVYKKSAPMFHEFNFPVHIQRGDSPLQFAEEYIIDLDEGDTVITATDGLFDNLYEQEIASIVSKSLQAAMKPEEIAQVLATRAQAAGKSATARSPFADAAKAAGYTGFTGGKLDDVVVIVSLVQNRSVSRIW